MQPGCPYYRVERFDPETTGLGGERVVRLPEGREISWCDHPNHAPVTREMAVGGDLMACRGNLSACLLSEEQLIDLL